MELYDFVDKTLYKNETESKESGIFTTPSENLVSGEIQGDLSILDGYVQNKGFETGVSGWRIDAEGNAEFNDGVFRGRFEVGGTQITIDNTDNIQTNIDIIEAAGGGTLYLQNGTYTLTSDIEIPSGVKIEGVNRDSVIINCNVAYAIKIIGTDVYSTGTVTLNNGATTVVGSGTTWTADMVGRYILLDGLWYEITAFTDTTHITIDTYQGDNLSGSVYVLANTNFNAGISKITITGATGSGVVVQYAMEPNLYDNVVYDNGTGIEMDYVTYPRIVVTSNENGVNMSLNYVEGFVVDFSEFNYSTTGNGITMNETRNSTFFNSSVNDNTGDGINMTSCDTIAFLSFDISGNGGQGIEMVSGCNDNQFTSGLVNANGSDGIKLTATNDRNTLTAISLTNNGGYGVNIAASTCDDNQIISPAFESNTSGNINNSGTNTVILPETYTFTAGEQLYAGDVVYPTANNTVERVRPTSFASTSTTFTEAAAGRIKVLQIDNTRTLHIIGGSIGGNIDLKAYIGTINAGETDMTYGSAYTFDTTTSSWFDVCQYDTNKFLVHYVRTNATQGDFAVVLDVGSSGSTITAGTIKTLTTSGGGQLACTALDSTRVAISYNKGSDNKQYVAILSISGTTITENASVLVDANTSPNKRVSLALLTTDKLLCVYTADTADPIVGKTIDVSGTTPTVNGSNTIFATESSCTIGLDVISSTKVIVVFSYNDGTGAPGSATKTAILTISGSTITTGSTLTLTSGVTQDENYINIIALSPSVALTCTRESDTQIKYHLLYIDGTTITSTATQTDTTTSNSYASSWVCKFKPFKYLGVVGTQYGYVTLGSTSDKIIGITDEDIADTASGSVSVKGEVNSALTGLTAGSIYYVDDSGRPSTYSSTLSVRLGVAFNTTSIPIES